MVRSSKSSGQEEYFVDALEVVLFGNSLFYGQSKGQKPSVPASDYEVLEVREARSSQKCRNRTHHQNIEAVAKPKPLKSSQLLLLKCPEKEVSVDSQVPFRSALGEKNETDAAMPSTTWKGRGSWRRNGQGRNVGLPVEEPILGETPY